jgi:prepilin-type processing-associated H-X9-DG protein
LDDIPDGAAYTILVGEIRRVAPTLGWASGTRATLRNTGVPLNEPDPLAPMARSTPIAGLSANATQIELYEAVKALAASGEWPLELTGGFSSFHPGGCNFLFCDGSVHVVKTAIDRRVYKLLGNRDDGEAVSADSF